MSSKLAPHPPAATTMDPGGRRDKIGSKELVSKMNESLLTLFNLLSSTNVDIALYVYHHKVEEIRRDPNTWTKLDHAYTMYEEQANHCRRLWMKFRSMVEKEMSHVNTTGGTSALPEPRLQERLLPSLEYESRPGEGKTPITSTGRIDQVTPPHMDLAAIKRNHQRPADPVVDPPPPSPTRKVRRCLLPI